MRADVGSPAPMGVGSPDEPWIQSSGPTPTFASHLGATFAKVEKQATVSPT